MPFFQLIPPMRVLPALVVLLLTCVLSALRPAGAGEPVTLQLKWTHAFQFAGYYAAKELGYYTQAGLDVQLKPAGPTTDVVADVASGKTEFGVGTSSLLLARKAGKPVLALAVIFQHSPQVFIVPRSSAHQSVHDLVGKRIMIEPLAEELLAYLKRENIGLERFTRLPHSFKTEDLISGKVDAMSAYVTTEPFHLDQAGFDYDIYSPRAAGIDFYGDNLFTSEQQLRQHPERVRAFREASLRGWQYAMAHPEEVIELIMRKYAPEQSRQALRYEAAQMAYLMRSDLVAIGYMNPGRWRHIADTYADLGMLPQNTSLDGFLYEPNPAPRPAWHSALLAGALALAALAAAIALYILRMNRRLAQSLADVRQTEQRLKVLSTAIDQSPTSVLITGPDTVIEYVNPQFCRETGYTASEAIGQLPSFLQSGQTEQATYRDMWTRLKQGELWIGELVNRRKSGEVYWEEAHIGPVKDSAGKITHYVAVKLDITERKLAHDRLAHMAHHDVLTDLPNRALFFGRVVQDLALARRNKKHTALMFIDLDHFKPINDQYGHAVGDLVLQETARRLQACVRDSDSVGRIGGDEFVVLLSDVGDADSALRVADKIGAALHAPMVCGAHTLTLTSSIGVAMFPEHGEDDITLAKHADCAMYAAKAGGRHRVRLFHPSMDMVAPVLAEPPA